MKIAVFHELPRGGARRAINEFSKNLKENHSVDLFITDIDKQEAEKNFFTKIHLIPFFEKKWKGNNWKVRVYKDSIELWKLYILHKKIAQKIDRSSYDFVFVGASRFIEAPFILQFLKTPHIFYCSDPSYRILYEKIFEVSKNLDKIRYYYEKLNRLNRKILDRKNVKSALLTYSPSKFIAHKFKEIYNKKNDILYYGVDSKFFSPSNRKKDIDIFYIGSYDPIDGLDLLKSALEKMNHTPTVKLLIAEEEWISDDKKLREFYRRSKIMVCPARDEGLGAVLMEAMACGMTVVAVAEAGHKEIIIDKSNGYLVPRSSEILAKTLDNLLDNNKEQKLIGINARKDMVENWSWKKRTDDLVIVMKNIIKQTGKQA